MDKKKIIGTIIGVIMFIALIAGATFAWWSTTITPTNGSITGTMQNFVINYDKGTNITGLSILDSATIVPGSLTNASTGKLTVTAKRASTAMKGTFDITLNTTSSNALSTSGILHYAVCVSSCTAIKTGTTANLSNTSGLISTGTVTTSNQKLVNGYQLENISATSTATSFVVYLWMDQTEFYNSYETYMPGGTGLSYSGYITASATQD